MPLDTEALAETDGSQAAQPESQTETDSTDDPIIWGAEAIGRVINRNPRQVFHLAAIGAIPVKRVGGRDKRGGRLCARKSALLAIAG
jgi:hypothetical protein